jgi:hypothetical protein
VTFGESGAQSKLPVRCVSCLAGALLISLIAGAPRGFAALPDEAAGAAGAIVETATGAAPVPDLPQTAPPQVSVPEVPSTPEAVPTPSQVTRTPSDTTSTVSSASGGSSSVEGIAGAAKQRANAIAKAAPESTPSFSRSVGGGPSPDFREGARRGDRVTPRGEERTPERSESAPVAWFLAYVWPAIALTSGSEHLTPPTPPSVEGFDIWEGPLSSAIRVLHSFGEDRQPTVSVPGPRPSPPLQSPSTSALASALSTGVRILFYVAIAALLTLLALTVRAELTPPPRWPRHRR